MFVLINTLLVCRVFVSNLKKLHKKVDVFRCYVLVFDHIMLKIYMTNVFSKTPPFIIFTCCISVHYEHLSIWRPSFVNRHDRKSEGAELKFGANFSWSINNLRSENACDLSTCTFRISKELKSYHVGEWALYAMLWCQFGRRTYSHIVVHYKFETGQEFL